MQGHTTSGAVRGRARDLIAGIFAVLLLSGAACPADAADDPGVVAANTAFYAALNKMFAGDVAPMKSVWSHAADVTYMGPTGQYDRGWDAVLKNWEGQAAMKLGGKVEPAEMQITMGRDLAVVSLYEMGENTNAQGKVEKLRLRATNIFRKEGGKWKMIGHHTDTLPYLAK